MPNLNEIDFDNLPSPLELPEEDWQQIEASLGLDAPHLVLRRKVGEAVCEWSDRAYLDSPQVRPKHLKKWLTRIRNSAHQLRDALEYPADDPSDDTDQPDLELWAKAYVLFGIAPDILCRGEEGSALTERLEQLAADADRQLSLLPQDRGGRLPKLAFNGLILALSQTYETVKGKKPTTNYDWHLDRDRYTGPFFAFVEVVLKHCASDYPQTNLALGKAIQRALGEQQP